jgi:hypothetical protein
MVVPIPDTHPSATDMGGLSKDKVEALRQFMSRLNTHATAFSSFALTSNLSNALNAYSTPSDDLGH